MIYLQELLEEAATTETIRWLIESSIESHFYVKRPNICLLHLFKCEDMLDFLIVYGSKLNTSEFWTVLTAIVKRQFCLWEIVFGISHYCLTF